MDQSVFTEYDIMVLIDKSGSMNESAKGFPSRWAQAREITSGLAALAEKVDDDGITLITFGGRFIPKSDVRDGVKASAVYGIFDSEVPNGSTPLHSALDAAFDKKFASKKKAIIIVVGDGIPDDPVAVKKSIIGAASRLSDASEIRIVFLQVGNDKSAAKYLDDLDEHLNGAKFDIVNTIDFETANGLKPDEIFERAILDTHAA